MDDRTEEPGGDAPTVGYRLPAYVQPGPDWQALADRNAAGLRRQRWLKIAGVVLGTLCVAGLAVGAITLAGGGSRSSASGRQSPTPTSGLGPVGPTAPAAPLSSTSASASTSASTSASAGTRPVASGPVRTPVSHPSATGGGPGGGGTVAPLTPVQRISDAGTDTAPLSPATLYTASRLTIGGQSYTLAATLTDNPCWKGTTGGLGNILAPHGCLELLRATYVSGDHAVTVGVAVFDTASQAAAVMPQDVGQIQSLVRGSVPSFCVKATCPLTHATVGRYDYFTIAGTTDDKASGSDPVAVADGRYLAGYAYARLLARG